MIRLSNDAGSCLSAFIVHKYMHIWQALNNQSLLAVDR